MTHDLEAVATPIEQARAAAAAVALKPCPFCGEDCAELVVNQGDKWAHYEPSCLEVRTSYNTSDDAPWRPQAIAAWNRRDHLPALIAENERLAERVAKLEGTLFDAIALIGHAVPMNTATLVAGETLIARNVWKAGRSALGFGNAD